MPIPTKPAGKSILSDIATAGAGFAVGLKKEQEKQRAEALQKAMQEFDMNIKRQQLGFEGRQVGLQEAGLRLQQDEAARQEASRQVQQRLQQEQLAMQKAEAEANKQWRMQQRDLEYYKLSQEEKLLRLRLANEMGMKRLEVADRSNRDQSSLLNQMDDNLRQQIRDFTSTNGDLLGLIYNRSNVEEEWKAARDAAEKSGNKEEYNRYNDRLNKLAKFDDLISRQREVGDAMYDNLTRAGAISKQLGIPAPDQPVTDRRWRDYAPEEKQAKLLQLGQALLTNPSLDLAPFLDLGVSRQEIDAARRMAGGETSPTQTTPPAQSISPTPSGLRRESGPVLTTPPQPKPPQPGLNPSFMTVPEPGAIMQKKQDEVSKSLQAPGQGVLNRSPISLGGGNPDSLLAKYKFQLDKSPAKHRIIP